MKISEAKWADDLDLDVKVMHADIMATISAQFCGLSSSFWQGLWKSNERLVHHGKTKDARV